MKVITGIICQTYDYKENDKRLAIFTPEGFVYLLARGVKTKKSKLKNLINIFTIANFQYVEGRNNILNGVEIIESFFDVWADEKKNVCMSILVEIANKVLSKEKDTKNDFVNLVTALKQIAYGNANELSFVTKFIISTIQSLGLDIEFLAGTKEYDIILAFLNADFEDVATLPFYPNELKNVISKLIYLIYTELNINIVSLSSLLRLT